MTSGVKVHLRPPPHVSFVSGYPGLLTEPPSSQACLKGTVEVRPTSSGKAVEASKLVLEIRKTECISTSKGIRRYFELIGSQETVLWSAADKPNAKDGYAPLETSDHTFNLPIPTGLPPSAVVDKSRNTGIQYHLVATLSIRPKAKSFFGGVASSSNNKAPVYVTQQTEVLIEKHEQNPAWPIYAWQAEDEKLAAEHAGLALSMKRETTMYGSGDSMQCIVDITSNREIPVKIAKLEMSVREVIISKEGSFAGSLLKEKDGKEDPRKSLQTVNEIITLKHNAQRLLSLNETTSHTFNTIFPATHQRFTIQNAKHIDVKYFLRIRAFIEVPKEAKAMIKQKTKAGQPKPDEQPIKELVLDSVLVNVSPWSKKHGEWWKVKIGQIPANLNRMGEPSQRLPPVPVPDTSGMFHPTLTPNGTLHQKTPAALQSGLPNNVSQSRSRLSVNNISSSSLHTTSEHGSTRRHSLHNGTPILANGGSGAGLAGIGTITPPRTTPHRQWSQEGRDEWHVPPRNVQSDHGHGSAPYQAMPRFNASSTPNLQQSPYRQGSSLDGHTSAYNPSYSPQRHQSPHPSSGSPRMRMDGAYPRMQASPTASPRPKSGYGQQQLGHNGVSSPPAIVVNHHNQPVNDMRRVVSNPESVMDNAPSPGDAEHMRMFIRQGDLGRSHNQNIQGQPHTSAQQAGGQGVPFAAAYDRRSSVPASLVQGNGHQSAHQIGNAAPGLDRRQSYSDQGPRGNNQQHQNQRHWQQPARAPSLSTVTASPPVSPSSPSNTEQIPAPQPQGQWETAEQEKDRLYFEAKERARRSQESAGHSIPTPVSRSQSGHSTDSSSRGVPTPTTSYGEHASDTERVYKSVEGRAGTPVGLTRALSNPVASLRQRGQYLSLGSAFGDDSTSPGTQSQNKRHSTASTVLPYTSSQNSSDRNAVDSPLEYTDSSRPFTAKPEQPSYMPHRSSHLSASVPADGVHSREATNSSMNSQLTYQSGVSSASTFVDDHKLRYLQALAAREAYQQRMLGVSVPRPLSAWEEKQKLRQLYAEEQAAAERMGGQPDSDNAPDSGLPNGHAPAHSEVANKRYSSYGQGQVLLSPTQYTPPDQDQEQERLDPSYFEGARSVEEESAAYMTPMGSVDGYPRISQRASSNSLANGEDMPTAQILPSMPGYFPSTNLSSADVTSEHSGESSPYGFVRNPDIARGKQRQVSQYGNGYQNGIEAGRQRHDSLAEDQEQQYLPSDGNGYKLPPSRPPKPKALLEGTYDHLDSPIEPGYDFYLKRSMSQHAGP